MFYMHVHGMGTANALANQLKPALALIGTSLGGPIASASNAQPPADATPPLNTAKLARLSGHDGEQSGAVYKITVGREDLHVTEMGADVNARMGLNTWAAFMGTDAKAAIAGDVAMLAREVTPVLKALKDHGLDVVALHHHMTDTQPTVFFVHYWGTGTADTLVAGFRAALDQLGKGGAKDRP